MLACALAACSTPATRVVLLPQDGGTPSSVVVRSKGGEQVIDQPYQRVTAPRDSLKAPTLDQADPSALRQALAPLFTLAPPTPQNFTLYFDLGGTALTGESQRLLPEVLTAALARQGGDIVVTGHTDTRGAAGPNDSLSLRRAQEVRQLLLGKGFPAYRIEAAGRGERELAVPTADEVDEPANRRVTIQVR